MTFTIDVDNNITVLASSQRIEERQEGTETFSSPHQLAALAAQWPGSRLVEIWNSLPGVEPVERFTSRPVAAARIWKAIQNLQPNAGAQRRRVAPKKVSARNKAHRRTRPAGRDNTKLAKSNRAAATARRGHAAGHCARDGVANSQRTGF